MSIFLLCGYRFVCGTEKIIMCGMSAEQFEKLLFSARQWRSPRLSIFIPGEFEVLNLWSMSDV
jgi:hypothetical protein